MRIYPFLANRSINGIVPDITVSELHRDELRITRHPVEQGAEITDHAYKEPPEFEMRIGFSDAGVGPGYTIAMYQKLIALQAARNLLFISTGKRAYINCLIESVMTETSEGTSFSAVITLRFRQVIIARLGVTTVPEQLKHAVPATSAPTANAGDQQTSSPPPNKASGLAMLFGGGSSPATAGQLPVPQTPTPSVPDLRPTPFSRPAGAQVSI